MRSAPRREARLKVRSPGATDSIQRWSASSHGVRYRPRSARTVWLAAPGVGAAQTLRQAHRARETERLRRQLLDLLRPGGGLLRILRIQLGLGQGVEHVAGLRPLAAALTRPEDALRRRRAALPDARLRLRLLIAPHVEDDLLRGLLARAGHVEAVRRHRHAEFRAQDVVDDVVVRDS